MAHEPDTFVQKFLADNYALILNVSKTFSKQYEDLAHDVCVEITRCSDCLKRVTNVKSYVFITARNIFISRDKIQDHTPRREEVYQPDIITPHTLQNDYYNHPSLSPDEKFLLDLYVESDLDYQKTAAEIHMDRKHVSIKIKKICLKLRSLQ